MASPPSSAAAKPARRRTACRSACERQPGSRNQPCLPPRVTMWWAEGYRGVTRRAPKGPGSFRQSVAAAPAAGRGCGPGGGGRVVELEEPATAVQAHLSERRVRHRPVGHDDGAASRPRRPGSRSARGTRGSPPIVPAGAITIAPTSMSASSRGCSPAAASASGPDRPRPRPGGRGGPPAGGTRPGGAGPSDGVARRQPLIIPPSSTASVVATPSVS